MKFATAGMILVCAASVSAQKLALRPSILVFPATFSLTPIGGNSDGGFYMYVHMY
jgi:hypothetical protein